jgi:hypothetical protein
VADDLADPLDAGGVALHLGQAAGTSPAAIAVHDDRYVARHLIRRHFECRVGRRLGRGRSRFIAALAFPVNDRRRIRRPVYWASH